MVSASDLKFYKSASGGLGGAIDTSALIPSGTPNNLFSNVPNNERVLGEDYYFCFYLKNTHATEVMDNLSLWLDADTAQPDTTVKFGFETVAQTGYRWSPYFDLDGTEFDSTASSATYQVPHFTLAAWFKTSASMAERGYIVNKGGEGSESAGQNDNYSLAMNTNGTIRAGFEEGTGTDHYATSPLSYNDGLWHLAVVTYGGTTVSLFIDDMETAVATHSTTATPETSGTNPVVIGRRSRSSANFFTGFIDEVRIWDRALLTDSRTPLLDNTISQGGLIFEKNFGADDSVVVAQTIADVYTSPVNIDWISAGTQPSEPNIGQLTAGEYIPVWVWWHVDANAVTRIDDTALFAFTFDIPSGGTGTGGSGGGGSGGNPPPTPTDYKISFAGDWGCESATDDVIDLINSEGYDYTWGVGDNSYDGSASCWTSRFTALKNAGKFNSAYGNHEHEESAGINPYKTFLGHSTTYFSKQIQNMFFIVIDSNIDFSEGSNQHDFVVSELERVKNDSSVTWRVAIMHHPWFGADSDHSYNDDDMVQTFHELFTSNKVNFVFTGHNHNWQQTYQVAYNSSDPETPTVVDNTSPYSRTAAGLIHIVTGTGGHDSGSSLYALGSQPSFQAYQNRTHNGVFELVASSSGNTLTGRFRSTDGDTFGEFTIS